tara:strand:+ start:40 stop:456 length:417 start_codon:yes stop_codon:yes gene_type:complete
MNPMDNAWVILKNAYHPAIAGLMNRKYTQEAFNEGDPGTGEWGRNDFQDELSESSSFDEKHQQRMALDEALGHIKRRSTGLARGPPELSIDDEMAMEGQAEREHLADKGRDNPDMTNEKHDFADERRDNPNRLYDKMR